MKSVLITIAYLLFGLTGPITATADTLEPTCGKVEALKPGYALVLVKLEDIEQYAHVDSKYLNLLGTAMGSNLTVCLLGPFIGRSDWELLEVKN